MSTNKRNFGARYPNKRGSGHWLDDFDDRKKQTKFPSENEMLRHLQREKREQARTRLLNIKHEITLLYRGCFQELMSEFRSVTVPRYSDGTLDFESIYANLENIDLAHARWSAKGKFVRERAVNGDIIYYARNGLGYFGDGTGYGALKDYVDNVIAAIRDAEREYHHRLDEVLKLNARK